MKICVAPRARLKFNIMIKLTCAAASIPIYINPKKIIALETNTLEMGSKSWPVTRVWIGPGDAEFFPVKETPNIILSIIRQTRVDAKFYE